MKFGREFQRRLSDGDFPEEWQHHAIEYKHLKKIINKIYKAIDEDRFGKGDFHVLVDKKTGKVLDATLDPDAAKEQSAQELAPRNDKINDHGKTEGTWVNLPPTLVQDFFDLLGPNLDSLQALRVSETQKLEDEIFELGDAVEDVIQPVREGYEAKRDISYRDLYFWREMFRLYTDNPVFYSASQKNHGALTFAEAKARLEAYDGTLRSTGLLAKMRTPRAKQAAQHFLDINIEILRTMHFQEINARALTKILKKFTKRTHLGDDKPMQSLRLKYPKLLISDKSANPAGTFADSIAQDLDAEMATKVLAIVPQPKDWNCPVCSKLAWRPVNLGCCSSVFCIPCIQQLQQDGCHQCPVCKAETVMQANGRNIDFQTMEFLQKFFPLEVKQRQVSQTPLLFILSYDVFQG